MVSTPYQQITFSVLPLPFLYSTTSQKHLALSPMSIKNATRSYSVWSSIRGTFIGKPTSPPSLLQALAQNKRDSEARKDVILNLGNTDVLSQRHLSISEWLATHPDTPSQPSKQSIDDQTSPTLTFYDFCDEIGQLHNLSQNNVNSVFISLSGQILWF